MLVNDSGLQLLLSFTLSPFFNKGYMSACLHQQIVLRLKKNGQSKRQFFCWHLQHPQEYAIWPWCCICFQVLQLFLDTLFIKLLILGHLEYCCHPNVDDYLVCVLSLVVKTLQHNMVLLRCVLNLIRNKILCFQTYTDFLSSSMFKCCFAYFKCNSTRCSISFPELQTCPS